MPRIRNVSALYRDTPKQTPRFPSPLFHKAFTLKFNGSALLQTFACQPTKTMPIIAPRTFYATL